jgi:Arc/MetJ-type ribon-helix-helix transcriptional regulator
MARPKNSKISSTPKAANLFIKDENHITAQIKAKRFTNTAEAIRYYVNKGIEKDKTIDLAYTYEGKLIKGLQQQIVREELLPLKRQVDAFANVIEEFGKQQETAYQNLQGAVEDAINRLRIAAEENQNNTTFGPSNNSAVEIPAHALMMIQEGYRNTITLRSLFYIFLLVYQSGAISKEARLSKEEWEKFVHRATARSATIAVNQTEQLTATNSEQLALNLAAELFKDINNLYKNRTS